MAGAAGSYAELQEKLFGEGGGGKKELQISSSKFTKDAHYLGERMRRMQRGLLNPRSAGMAWWDLVILCCLIFTTFVTPFDLALVRETRTTD